MNHCYFDFGPKRPIEFDDPSKNIIDH